MTELDLLTDEERERIVNLRSALEGLSLSAHPLTAEAHAIHLEDAEFWVRALIAARAENKRKDEALRLALPVLEYIEKDQWSEAPPLGAKFDEAEALVKVRQALLQSEKGGE